MSGTQVAPAIVVAAGKTSDGTAYYEAKWRDRDDRQVKRRLGRAWVEPDGAGGWRKRRGRTPAGWLDERSVHIAAAEAVAAVEQQRAEKAKAEREAEQAAQLAAAVTFRKVAHEWLVWKREVKGGAPSTLRDNEALLREPGDPVQARRWRVRGPDHEALRRPADRDGHDPRGLRLPSPARQIRHAAAQRQQAPRPAARDLRLRDARGHPRLGGEPGQRHRHPLRAAPRRRSTTHEVDEVEALARVCEQGGHRGARHYRGRSVEESGAGGRSARSPRTSRTPPSSGCSSSPACGWARRSS